MVCFCFILTSLSLGKWKVLESFRKINLLKFNLFHELGDRTGIFSQIFYSQILGMIDSLGLNTGQVVTYLATFSNILANFIQILSAMVRFWNWNTSLADGVYKGRLEAQTPSEIPENVKFRTEFQANYA